MFVNGKDDLSTSSVCRDISAIIEFNITSVFSNYVFPFVSTFNYNFCTNEELVRERI